MIQLGDKVRYIGTLLLAALLLLGCAAKLAQEPQKPAFTIDNGISYKNMDVLLVKGPHVEIVYVDRLGEKDERRGVIRIYDKDDKLIVDVDGKGNATYGAGYTGNEAALTFWKALADYYPQICTPKKAAPLRPRNMDCGVPIKFTDGSSWIFPCWPEKDVPKCVEGCK